MSLFRKSALALQLQPHATDRVASNQMQRADWPISAGSNRPSDLNLVGVRGLVPSRRCLWIEAPPATGPALRSAESCSRSLVRRSVRCPSSGLAPRIRTLLKCKTITGCGEIPVEPAINESIEILATAVVMVEVVRVLPQIDRQQACDAPVLRGICA